MPRRKVKLDLTLFPFLSVLCGLIAVMVLFMIVTLSTRVISSTAVAEAGAPAAPGPDRPEEGIDGDAYRRLDARVQELEGVLAERIRVRNELWLQLQQLEAVVAAKKRARDATADRPAGVRLGEPTPVKMLPKRDKNAPNKTAVFIEVSSTGYVVHPGKRAFPPARLADAGGPPAEVAAELRQLFEEMARGRDRYPLLLVHTNGVDAYDALLGHLRNNHPGLDVGWEPFAREWLLDQN